MAAVFLVAIFLVATLLVTIALVALLFVMDRFIPDPPEECDYASVRTLHRVKTALKLQVQDSDEFVFLCAVITRAGKPRLEMENKCAEMERR